jgi:hypothetical protein
MHANDLDAKIMEWNLNSGQIIDPSLPLAMTRFCGILKIRLEQLNVRCHAIEKVVSFVAPKFMSATPTKTKR